MSTSRNNNDQSSTEAILKALDAKLGAAMRAQEKLEARASELQQQLEKDPSNKELQTQLDDTYNLMDEYEDESDHIASYMFSAMR